MAWRTDCASRQQRGPAADRERAAGAADGGAPAATCAACGSTSGCCAVACRMGQSIGCRRVARLLLQPRSQSYHLDEAAARPTRGAIGPG
eukprot:15010167-Alexandrium_andersonii.AAC.1